MSRPVDWQTRLRGGWYALEQSGHLLDDAVSLLNAGRRSTAVGVALLAREEQGKARLLFSLAGQAEVGATLTRGQIIKMLEDHPRKQERSARHIPTTGASAQQHAALSDASMPVDRVKRSLRRLAHVRTALRERAFYVDLAEDGDWSRPSQAVSAEQAMVEVLAARNDYALMVHLIGAGSQPGWADLRRRLSTWPDRPPLPVPGLPGVGAAD